MEDRIKNMKAEELQIGDIVNYRFSPSQCVVTGINVVFNGREMITLIDANGETYSVIKDLNDIEPILITQPFLDNNDFVSTHNKEWGVKLISEFDWVMLWCENYWVGVKQIRANLWKIHVQGDTANMDGGVCHIHDLQHAIRACGIKKEIRPGWQKN